MIKYYKSQLNNKLIERKIQCTSRECKINKIFVEFYIFQLTGSYDRKTIILHPWSLWSEIFEVKVNDSTFLIKGKRKKKKALKLLPFRGKYRITLRACFYFGGRLSILFYLEHRYPQRGSKNSLTCSSLIYVNWKLRKSGRFQSFFATPA